MGKIKRILIIALIIILILGNIGYAKDGGPIHDNDGALGPGSENRYHDFGIEGFWVMPKIDGCSDDFDKELYFAGIAAGIDPALLKTVMYKESNGNPAVEDNKNDHNNTYDIGLMQINTGGLSGLGLTDSEEDLNALRSNHMLNFWAATEILKAKYGTAKRLDKKYPKNVTSEKMSFDSFGILWAYNGASEKGLNYANSANPIYREITKLEVTPRVVQLEKETTVARFMEYRNKSLKESIIDLTKELSMIQYVHATNKSSVRADLVITNPETMSYDRFSSIVKDLSNGLIVPDKYQINEKMREDYRHVLTDESSGTGIYYEQTPEDVIINYKVYRLVKSVITIINKLVVILSYIAMALMALYWAVYAVALAGFTPAARWLYKITNGRIDTYADGSLRDMVITSLVSAFIISLVLTGVIQTIIEKAILFVLSKVIR